MWNSIKSVRLSLFCTRAVMLLVVICAAAAPKLIERYMNFAFMPIEGSSLLRFMAILYLCCIPAMTALVCLHILLSNIRRERVFVPSNVKLLRGISWCCFAAALVLVFTAKYYLLLGITAVAVAFIGLILRVVKNVIEEAVAIKAENDGTI